MGAPGLIEQATALRERLRSYVSRGENAPPRAGGAKAQVCEFFRIYAGPRSAFLAQAEAAAGYDAYQICQLSAVVEAFLEYLQAGLHSTLSPERRAQLDVVSDILEQAQRLIESGDCHPATGAMLVGASLEECLRNWVEADGLSIGNARPGLDSYAKALRSADLITKQDAKDITAWAGIRNHAAHGEWDHVADRARIRLMLEGVNLFMRQRTPSA